MPTQHTPKLGETKESVRGILVRLSPEDGERLKNYPALLAAAKAMEEAICICQATSMYGPHDNTCEYWLARGQLRAAIAAQEGAA